MNPVNTPINKRSKNSCHTEVTNPINNTDKARPLAENIRIRFRPYLSPIFPHIGEKIRAVTKVMPNTQPDHVCTNDAVKSPKFSIYNDKNGRTIVMLPAMKKLANHMIHKFFLARCSCVRIEIPSSSLFRLPKYIS